MTEKTPTKAELQERVEALERERDEYLDSLQRLKAEFDNFRKRTAREQESFAAWASEKLLKELLPVLDDLERALDAAEQHEEAAAKPPVRDSGPVEGVRGNREVHPGSGDPDGAHTVFEGVRLVHRSLLEALQKQGLELIETDGAFDPHVHEALLAQPAEGTEPGSVLQVLQKGYRLGDRVLRPARVVVAD